ncbi:hypothetical protein LZK76_36530 (plasmid) [Rhizobium leguminosarum]|nr:hypothetical protein LZK76_36530 [Rhizobium leguminosarum]
MPRLIALSEKLDIFFEVKANLKRHEVEKLAAGGVRWIQPGIESLDSRVLKLMGKGTTAAQNVQLLKWCRQFGVRPIWSVLWASPERATLGTLKCAACCHCCIICTRDTLLRLRYQRFSLYHRAADQYGLTLSPAASYRYVYPLSERDLADQVYHFEDGDDNDGGREFGPLDTNRRPGVQAVIQGMDARARHGAA